MHLVAETFHTLHLRRWEAAQLWNEVNALLGDADKESEDYPALHTFLTAIGVVAEAEAETPLIDAEDGEITAPTDE